jgi:hypothetical protein
MYTNSYTGDLIIQHVLQIVRVCNCQFVGKDEIIDIADIIDAFNNTRWNKKGGIKG